MKTIILFALIIASVTMYGQADFSGNWKLNTEKSQFNNTPGSPAAANLVVQQKADSITYQRNDRPKESLKIDGTDSLEISDANSKTEVTVKLATDKSGLIETRTYSYPADQTGEVAAKKTRTWSLSEDKQTLTIQDHIESTTGKTYDMILIYER
jgi:hypothetical protein